MSRLARQPVPALMLGVWTSVILTGAVLLMLPISAHEDVSFVDALFTATSAATVTGLVVLDTGGDFTLFGQAVIMALIQFGGLGLITVGVFVLSALGQRITFRGRQILAQELNVDSIANLIPFVRRILIIFVVCELVGWAILSLVFVPEQGWWPGLWTALFHTVSAFNNAGFSTFSDSLMGYAGNPLVMITISAQFILSGLGLLVLNELWRTRRWSKLSMHSQLMLVGTLILIGLGVTGFAALEWNNPDTLGGMDGVGSKMLAAWFEGVTPRTAGFNATDTGAARDTTALMTIVLMFIGGGATSTAGGIKVTTAFVLFLALIAFFRRDGIMRFQGHEIGAEQSLKVMALLFVAVMVVFAALFIITAGHEMAFLDAMFETVSAFGTVGLSRGATGDLNTIGKLTLCVVMLLGRLGPLTLGFLLSTKTPPNVRYPEGRVLLG